MTSKLCCHGPTKEGFSEDRNVRYAANPINRDPRLRHRIPSTQGDARASSRRPDMGRSEHLSLLTSMDGHDMQSIKLNDLLYPHELTDADMTEPSTSLHSQPSSYLMRIIRKRFSHESPRSEHNSHEAHKASREENILGNKFASVDPLSLTERSPSQGGYDPDAKPLEMYEMSLSSESGVSTLPQTNLVGRQILETVRERSGEQSSGFEEVETGDRPFRPATLKDVSSTQPHGSTLDLSKGNEGSSSTGIQQDLDPVAFSDQRTQEEKPHPTASVIPEYVLPFVADNLEQWYLDYDHQVDTTIPESSLHLQNMRISQHLRSFSCLSDNSTIHPSDDPRTFTSSEHNPSQTEARQRTLHRKSSSGFTSVKVPVSWGKVLTGDSPPEFPTKLNSGLEIAEIVVGNSGASTPEELERPIGLRGFAPVQVAGQLILSNGEGESGNVDHTSNSRSGALTSSVSGECARARDGVFVAAHTTAITPNRARKNVASFDGPSDHLLSPPEANRSRPSMSTRRSSVTENFDDAANLWGKAFKAHQDNQSTSSRKRNSRSGSSVSTSETYGLIAGKTFNDEGFDPLHGPGSESSDVPLLKFKPINTEHSFDRLTVPGRFSISHPSTPSSSIQDLRRDSATAMGDSRDQSVSEPTKPGMETQAKESKWTGTITTKNNIASLTEVPEITLTGPETTNPRRDSKSSQRGSRSSLTAWSRYPSHTRDERNRSAGPLDNVIVRDFVPPMSDPNKDSDAEDQGKGSEYRKTNRKRVKARNLIWKAKSLPGWPSRFFQRNSGFRQRESGHRSSIAVGGVLEYPELELLPGAEVSISPEWNESSPFSQNTALRRSSFQDGGRGSAGNQPPASRLGSSEYGASRYDSPTSSDPDGVQTPPLGWVTYYGEAFAKPTRHPTDLISPLDGYGDSQDARAALHSPSVRSLPLALYEHPVTPRRSTPKTTCLDEMRNSTRDLRKMLEDGERVEATQAVQVAEDVWRT